MPPLECYHAHMWTRPGLRPVLVLKGPGEVELVGKKKSSLESFSLYTPGLVILLLLCNVVKTKKQNQTNLESG